MYRPYHFQMYRVYQNEMCLPITLQELNQVFVMDGWHYLQFYNTGQIR